MSQIDSQVSRIYVVDDLCPEQSGHFVLQNSQDPRLEVLFNEVNQGVGGATMAGYKRALADGADIIVKIDGDGQMDPGAISDLIRPIQEGRADYTKGNRFYAPENLKGMPVVRIVGNTGLSFITKVSSGYWNLMDPTNGFTAIHAGALSILNLERIDKRYFFESDMLFRLNTIRAVVQEVPMRASYGDEESGLSILKALWDFPHKHCSRLIKRIFYNYILRDFNVGTIELFGGLGCVSFGGLFGVASWYRSYITKQPTLPGTVMLAVMPVIIGVQLLLAAIALDVSNVPKVPLQGSLRRPKNQAAD